MPPGTPKLSDYVEFAAADYTRETGRIELDARWIAEFINDSGVLDVFPQLDLLGFAMLVEKALIRHAERAEKQARSNLERIARRARKPRGA